MTTTKSTTDMAKPSRNMPSGTVSRSTTYQYSGTAVTASANALRVNLCRIPNGATILSLTEAHSSGAATSTVKLGIKDTALNLSAFGTSLAQATNNQAKAMSLPYTVSIPDSQATKYAYLVAGVTLGTATNAFQIKTNVIYSMDQ